MLRALRLYLSLISLSNNFAPLLMSAARAVCLARARSGISKHQLMACNSDGKSCGAYGIAQAGKHVTASSGGGVSGAAGDSGSGVA